MIYLPEHIPRKTRFINFRIDKEGAEKIFNGAKDANLTVSEFVREKMGDLKIPNLPNLKALDDLREIRNSLVRHGNKIKEIATTCECTPETKSQLAQEVIEYGRIKLDIEAIAKIFDVYFGTLIVSNVTEDTSIVDIEARIDDDVFRNYLRD